MQGNHGLYPCVTGTENHLGFQNQASLNVLVTDATVPHNCHSLSVAFDRNKNKLIL